MILSGCPDYVCEESPSSPQNKLTTVFVVVEGIEKSIMLIHLIISPGKTRWV